MNEPYMNLQNEEQVKENVILPFLRWSKKYVFERMEASTRQCTASSAGLVIGGISAAVMYELGEGFGDILCELLHIDDENARLAVRNFFGTGALIPMVALGAIATQDYFKQCASPASPETKQIMNQNKKYIKDTLKVFAYVLAVFSAIPQSSLTYIYLKNPIFRFIATPAAVLAPFLFNSNAEIQLINRGFRHFNQGQTKEIRAQRAYLQNRLTETMKIISDMSDEKINALFNEILGEKEDKGEDKNSSLEKNKVKSLFNLDISNKTAQTSFVSKAQPSFGKTITGAVGFTMGAAGSYVYYTLGDQAVDLVCDYAEIDDPETRKILKNIVGSLAYIPCAALGAVNAQNRFEAFYDKFITGKKSINQFSWSKLRSGISKFAIFEGALSATPLVYIAVQSAINGPLLQKLLVIPTFMTPFCIRSNALDKLLNRGVDAIDERFCKTTKTHQNALVKAALKLQDALADFPDEQITAIYQDLLENKPDMLVSITVDTPKLAEATPLLSNKEECERYDDKTQHHYSKP